jgi:hypothetical protein
MKLKVMRKMNQWKYVSQPLQHPLIIKHQLSSKEKIKETKTLSLCTGTSQTGDSHRSDRCRQGHINLLDGQEGKEEQEEEAGQASEELED